MVKHPDRRFVSVSARHESFTRAAEELGVTQGAVSQQVKALEAGLGIKLFNCERQRPSIAEAGRDYLVIARDALDRIALGAERLLRRQNAGVSPSAHRPQNVPASVTLTASGSIGCRT